MTCEGEKEERVYVTIYICWNGTVKVTNAPQVGSDYESYSTSRSQFELCCSSTNVHIHLCL